MAGNIDESLLPAWDQAHIVELDERTFELYGAYHQISAAEAETLVDSFGTVGAAAARFPHIAQELIERAFVEYAILHGEEVDS